MNKKIRNAIFSLIVFSLIFNNIPKPIQANFLGGPIGDKLVVYPLLVGFVYSCWCHYKGYRVWIDAKYFIRYICAFIGVMLLSTIVGLIQYPYYELVLNGPVNQIEKLPVVLDFLHSHGIDVDSKLLLQLWMIARQIKAVFFEVFLCFGGAYMIYCWYKDDVMTGMRIMARAVGAAVVVLVGYAIIEISYLAGNEWAAGMLSVINPYIHTIVTGHGWWPPLLWPSQMRLVFPEPSFVGSYMAFALPVIWGVCFYCKKALYRNLAFIATIVMAFMMFMTKARTAYAILVGMLGLLLVLLLVTKEWYALRKYGVIILCVLAGFAGYVQFYSIDMNGTKGKGTIVIDSVENNLGSLASSNKRSNAARYGALKAHMRLGMDYPLLGVGKGLYCAYVEEYFTPEELAVDEIKSWVDYQHQYGVLVSQYSIPEALNEYVSKFSESGLFGVLVTYFPFIFILFKLYKKMNHKDILPLLMFLALSSSMAAGCNGNLNIIYSAWIILGLSYAVCFGKSDDVV